MTVSIILPTYNRASFLPAAFESIRSQTFCNWELIVVDDGSADETSALVEQFGRRIPQRCRYIYQENAGAYAARNTGLDNATGEYIAFYDSDDRWMDYHLEECVTALTENPDVDWVYGPSRRVKGDTGEVVVENTFYSDGRPKGHLTLKTRDEGKLRIIDDEHAVTATIKHGLCAPLQNSVMRQRVFDDFRFDSRKRNGGDRMLVLRSLKRGIRFGYLPDIQVLYTIHDSNSSAVGIGKSNVEKQKFVLSQIVSSYQEMLNQNDWTRAERRSLRRKLGGLTFWHLGYGCSLESGQTQEALKYFREGLSHWPWDWRCWKSYLLCKLRSRGRHLGSSKFTEGMA